MTQLVSLELSRKCSKGCAFCYNASGPSEGTSWTEADVTAFLTDCAANGVEAFSFGGGEPLESELLWPALTALRGAAFRSLTTNGLPLRDPAVFDALVAAAPDKVHVSIHFPGRAPEVERVVAQVVALADAGVTSGVNLLVRSTELDAAASAARALHDAGVGNERIVYLPMRGAQDTPTPAQVAAVAGGKFQSTWCLSNCEKSARFVSVGADRRVGWCSYTTARRVLARPDHKALVEALDGLPLRYC